MKNKTEVIQKLNTKNQMHENAIKTLTELINSTQEQFNEISVKNKETYKEYVKSKKVLHKLNKKTNCLKGKLCKNKFLIEQLQSIPESESRFKLNSDELYQYIKKIEQLNEKEIYPFKFSYVWKVNYLYWKILHFSNKRVYLQNVKLPLSDSSNQFKIKKQIDKISKKIEESNNFLNSLFSLFYTTYHAKLVNKLDAMKKVSSSNSNNNQTANDNVIELKNVVKYYHTKSLATKVLDNVNLTIKKGEFVVILGPSGSGKTTLLNIISGMDNATYGETIVAGENLINYNQNQLTSFRRKNIGYVFQQYGLLPNLNVKENVEIGKNLQTDESKSIDVEQVLRSIGLYQQIKKYPNELSGGQQQRVSIARSVVKNPNILFGDEPTGAIDQETSKQIMDLFLTINQKYKTTIVIVTHNPVLAELASLVINVGDGTVKSVIKNDHPKTVNDLNWSMTFDSKKATE